MTRVALAAAVLLVGLAATAHAEPREEMLFVPSGGDVRLETRLCRPAGGGGDAPLVVVSHGSTGATVDRGGWRPWECSGEVARFFNDRGYAVAFPMRRGYGRSGGAYAESSGPCSNPDFVGAGMAGAEDIAATIAHVTTLPGVARDRTVVAGHSGGGWASLAYGATRPAGLVGVINVSGGRGGPQIGPSAIARGCVPGALARAAGAFARASVPSLWLYTANDRLFVPELSQAMFAEFKRVGGDGSYVLLEPWGDDGHGLFDGGGVASWGPPVERFLAGLAR